MSEGQIPYPITNADFEHPSTMIALCLDISTTINRSQPISQSNSDKLLKKADYASRKGYVCIEGKEDDFNHRVSFLKEVGHVCCRSRLVSLLSRYGPLTGADMSYPDAHRELVMLLPGNFIRKVCSTYIGSVDQC